ncbi:MAG: alpha-galactosidase [Verrucomicrobia bacterium]|nr:alpha-galactosidase [Verrucomicrobiota bacterium]
MNKAALALLALLTPALARGTMPDWLVDPVPFAATILTNTDRHTVELNNGLVRRVFRLQPNAATIAFDNLMTGAALLRSVRPEARVELNGVSHEVGGLAGQPIHNYLDASWLNRLKANPAAFRCTGHHTGRTRARFAWKPRRQWMTQDMPWPPPGVSLTLSFEAPPDLARGNTPGRPAPATSGLVTVDVHYELFDGLPLLTKWIVLRNGGAQPLRLNSFTSEILAAVEPESNVDPTDHWEPMPIHVESDYAFGGMSTESRAQSVRWLPDPLYTSQVNYDLKTPCLLECRPSLGPDQILAPGGRFESFRVFELVHDSTERERRGLALRRFYRTVAPWVTENPVLMHVRSAQPDAVRLAIDQCAEVGFEMVIMTFGSGFNFESRDPKYQDRIKELADYGRSKGIALGGYSLLASRSAATPADNTQGVPARFGVMPCLGATWGQHYLAQLQHFIRHAGLAVLEHDGSYPGDRCAATNHPGHRGLDDSQWAQWKAITGFYQWCRARGVYLNVPDFYFLAGSSKTGMGYREVNWSLPREYQEIIERQNIFDGTWDKTPGMGWMFVPLTEYHGGGPAATIEPLNDHLPHYETRLASLFGAGVIACYRGPRLYDTDATKAVVKRWVDFYRRHRPILNSDLVHLRRADGRDWDGWLHVNPALRERGLAMIYNPLREPITRTLSLPLYYTGLTETARIRVGDAPPCHVALTRNHHATVTVTVPAQDRVAILVESPQTPPIAPKPAR